MLNELTHKDTLIVKNTRQHRRSLGQGEGCVCANSVLMPAKPAVAV